MHWHHFFICCLTFGWAPLSLASQQGPNSRRGGNNGNLLSPIRELGPSLAASVAGGTIIAARSTPRRPSLPSSNNEEANDDECLVVLFRSPIVGGSGSSNKQLGDVGNLTVSSVYGSSKVDDDNDQQQQTYTNDRYHGLTFLPNGPVNFPSLHGSSSGSNNNNLRILHAPSGLLLAATGFAPDATHMLNVAAGRILSRISVFDAPSSPTAAFGSSGKSVDPHRLVRDDLSSMMIDAAMSDGGRPLGVQLLVIGQTALTTKQAKDNAPSLELYTIDPSGGWRSCIGKGTSVGRGAERVCSSLFSSTMHASSNDTPSSWRDTLDTAMMAAIDALEHDQESHNDDDDQSLARANYSAIVIFGCSNKLRGQISTSRCALVNSAIIEECYKRCRARIQKLAR